MRLLSVLTFILMVARPSFLSAQDPVVSLRLKEIGERFGRLPIEKRVEYVKLKKKAAAANEKQNFFTCMIASRDALAIFPEDIDLIWLQGICRAQIHDVDSAIVFYERVLKIDPAHFATLMNLVEVNFFDGRFRETVERIQYIHRLLDSRGGRRLPLLDFKYLVSLTNLSGGDSGKGVLELERARGLHTFMDDNPFYYYANALECFHGGKKQDGLLWVLKAYHIFNNAALIDTWNKALVDTGYIGAHEIVFNRSKLSGVKPGKGR